MPIVAHMEILKSQVYRNQLVFVDKAHEFAELLLKLFIEPVLNIDAYLDTTNYILVEAAELIASLTKDNPHKHVISALYCALFETPYSGSEKKLLLQGIFVRLCDECLKACSEIAAAQVVNVVSESKILL